MKYIIILIYFIFFPLFVFGQDTNKVTLKSWNLSYTLPSNNWNLVKSSNTDEGLFYIYVRTTDQDKNTGIASMAIVGELLSNNIDVINYSIKLRESTSYNIIKLYSPDDKLFDLNNCIGYLAENTDAQGKHHKLLILHLVYKDKGIQIVLETVNENFLKLEPEFNNFIKSLKIIK